MELVRERKDQGNYRINIKISNELASGVYFYKLKVNEFIDVKKMIIAK